MLTAITPRRRRGATIVYLAISMAVFCGLASLGVDVARVQLAKTELQRAADAAARYAVQGLPVPGTAQNNAVTAASENLVDGQSLALDINNDIEFGTWDNTTKVFSVLTGTARSSADSIRVTARRTTARGNAVQLAFARVLGRNTCDVSASAICKITRLPAVGLVGLSSVTISGNGNTDSYNSSTEVYSKVNADKAGHVLSNGNISVLGNGTVNGDAHPGIGMTVNQGNKAVITGTKTPLDYKLVYPDPKLPKTYTTYGDMNISSGTYYVAAGDYYCTSLSISNSAVFNCSGPIRLYVAGPINITGGSIKTYQNLPKNFQIYVMGAYSVSLAGQADFYAQVYAPRSAFSQAGKADIYGSIVADTLTFSGTWDGGVHYDSTISGGGMNNTIAIVK